MNIDTNIYRGKCSHRKKAHPLTQSNPHPPHIMNVIELALWSLPLLVFVQFNTILPGWGSRKVLHITTGLLLMQCSVFDPAFQYATYAVTLLAVLAIWNVEQVLHFAAKRDVGVTNYLIFCSLCVALRIELKFCAPLFLADPAGAIVGKNWKTAKLVGDKSVGGTLAVFLTAAASLIETPLWGRLLSGLIICIIEAVSGKFDNPLIGAYLLVHHYIFRILMV